MLLVIPAPESKALAFSETTAELRKCQQLALISLDLKYSLTDIPSPV